MGTGRCSRAAAPRVSEFHEDLIMVTRIREFVRGVAFVVVALGSSSLLAQNSFVFQNQDVNVGQTGVKVPVLVTNSEPRHGLSFSIKYDQAKLRLTDVSLVGSDTSTAQWDGGLIHDAQGEVTWGIVMGFTQDPGNFDENVTFPAGANRTAAFLVFDVIAVAPGTAAIQFQDDLASFAPTATKNRLTTAGTPIAPTPLGAATITIKQQTVGNGFIRGDCDGNGAVSGVGDAIFQLTVNFIGGSTPRCRAACDANGDGAVTGVNDAILNLTRNFLGGVVMVAPFPNCDISLRAGDLALGCADDLCN